MDQSQQIALFYEKATLQLHSTLSSAQNPQDLAVQFLSENEISWTQWVKQIRENTSNELTTLSLIKFVKEWLRVPGTPAELFCNNFFVLRGLTESGVEELENLALVIIRDFISPLFEHQQILINITDNHLSELFGLVINQLNSHSTGTAQYAKLALMSFAQTQGGHSIILNKSERLFALFEKGLEQTDATIQIRFMVMLIELANLAEDYFQILEGIIHKIIERILKEDDMLVKLNMIQLIPLLAHTNKGRKLMKEANFLQNYLKSAGEDPFGLVDHTIILLIANLVSNYLTEFGHLINQSFLTFLLKNGKSSSQVDRKCFLESLSLIFQNKQAFSKLYEAQGLLRLYLSHSQTTLENQKILFYDSLAHLLQVNYKQDLTEQEKVFSFFSNLGEQEYSKYYNNEKLVKSIEFIISATDVPFEGQELGVLGILYNMIDWNVGFGLIFRSSKTLSYLLTRTVKAKEVVELKFKVIEKILTNPKAKEVDQGLIQQFKKYHQQGVYGEYAEKSVDPSLITEST